MNKTAKCENFEPLISAMLDGELDPDAMRELDFHLLHCPACQTQVAGFRNVDDAIGRLSIPRPSAQSQVKSISQRGNSHLQAVDRQRFTVWRLIPLAVAATLLVCVAIAAWPNPQPVRAEQFSTAQFVEPVKDLHLLNLQKQNDQALMLRTLSMDLRSLKLEINQLQPGSAERENFAKQIDEMIAKVRAFE